MSAWVGAGLATLLAGAGHALGWLTRGGAVAASLVGAAVFIWSGVPGAALLALFFITGSLLTRRSSTRHRVDVVGGPRTARQVVANGSWAASGAIALALDAPVGWAVLAGSLAAAQADTWATEIGVRATNPPRLLTTGEHVPPGTSGAVTLLGSCAGASGALVMAGAGWAFGLGAGVAVAAFIGGIAGMAADSMLGATLQSSYRCDVCGVATEHAAHRCGNRARLLRGIAWLDNDVVNLVSSGLGAACATLVWFVG